MKGYMKSTNGPSRKTGKRLITSITENKKHQMVVCFGYESLTLSADAFTEHPLYVGKEVSPLEYREILAFVKNESLLDYGMALAAKGCYSSHEIREKLRKKATDEEKIREIMFNLRQEGFLDDESYAKEYKEEKEHALYGRERILQELRFSKGINPEILAKLTFNDEEENAKKAALLLAKKYSRLPLAAQKRKGIEALTRRGFSLPVASQAVELYHENKTESGKSLRLLCEKTVKKYQSKYNGYELRAKCFAYLLSKGYRSEEIASVLEEYL